MNNIKKIIPAISLLLITILAFSGCGVLSLVKKPPVSEVVNTEPSSVDGANAVIPIGETVEATRQSEDETSTTAPAVTEKTNTKPSSKPSGGNSCNTTAPTPETAAPATDESKDPDLSNLSVKEVQDMLFNTTDPNVAGKILTIAGFEYDAEQGIYYSQLDPLQRLFGFNVIYDAVAPRTGMIYSTKRIFFDYDGKNWMIQIWKGQYGITAGAEIGLYNKPEDRLVPQYDCAKDEELITMAFDFYNGGKYEFTRGPEKHWWLTGFKILQLGVGPLIDLDITLEFPNRKMANAFEKGLKNAIALDLVDRMTYERDGKVFKIEW